MNGEGKRLMVHFPPDLADKLDDAKKSEFYAVSKSEMIRTLVLRGLLVDKVHPTAAAQSNMTEGGGIDEAS